MLAIITLIIGVIFFIGVYDSNVLFSPGGFNFKESGFGGNACANVLDKIERSGTVSFEDIIQFESKCKSLNSESAKEFALTRDVGSSGTCGNGLVETEESCDGGDGCSSECRVELGYVCNRQLNECNLYEKKSVDGDEHTDSHDNEEVEFLEYNTRISETGNGYNCGFGLCGASQETPFSILILRPSELFRLAGYGVIDMFVSSGEPVDRVELFLNGDLLEIDEDFSYRFEFNTANYLEGQYQIQAKAYSNGQEAISQPVNVIVDNTLPIPERPAPLSGETSPLRGISYQYSVEDTSFGYLVDWGDGSQLLSYSNPNNINYVYPESGEYSVRIKSFKFGQYGYSQWSDPFVVNVQANDAPTVPSISGERKLHVETEIIYTVSGESDTESNQIKYEIDWGDGTRTETDFVPEDTEMSFSNSWLVPGIYSVWACTEDEQGTLSVWSDPLTVTVDVDRRSVEVIGNINPHPAPISSSSGPYAGLWHYSADGKDYALVTSSAGLSIIDVTEGSPISEVQYIPLADGARDVDFYQNYAYVGGQFGPINYIIDLSGLPESVEIVADFPELLDYTHTMFIEDGYLFISKFYSPNGYTHMYSLLGNPLSPELLWTSPINCHDGQAIGDRLYLGCTNNNRFYAYDISDHENPVYLGITHEGFAKGHSVAIYEEGNILFGFDENNLPDIRMHDISDPNEFSGELLNSFALPAYSAVSHNGDIEGNLLYTAYQEAGFVVLDITDPINPVHTGVHNTHRAPAGDGAFYGAFGVTAGLENRILVSDRNSGLWVYRVHEPCISDIDRNENVGFAEVLRILASWENTDGFEDVDGSGIVGFSDVLQVLADWGSCFNN